MLRIGLRTVICLYLLIFLSAAAPAYASDAVETYKSYFSPIDMAAQTQKILKIQKQSMGKSDAENENDARATKMFNSLGAHNFLLSRIVLYGIDNIDAAAEMVESQGNYVLSENRKRQQKAQEIMTDRAKGKKNYGNAFQHKQSSYLNYENTSEDFNKGKVLNNSQVQYLQKSYKNIAVSLKGIFLIPGMDSKFTLYNRVSIIGFFILVICSFVRLCFIFYDICIGKGGAPGKFIGLIQSFLLYFLYIFFMRLGVSALMLGSLAVRDVIIGASGGDITSIIDDVREFSYLRAKLVSGMDPNASLFSLIFTNLGTWISGWVSYLTYAITACIVYVMVILGDVMMAITLATAPIVAALSMIPAFKGWFGYTLNSFVTFSLYMPAAGVYLLSIAMVQALMPSISFAAFICISIGFFFGAVQIPNIASSLSGAGALAAAMTAILASAKVGSALAFRGMKRMIGLP